MANKVNHSERIISDPCLYAGYIYDCVTDGGTSLADAWEYYIDLHVT